MYGAANNAFVIINIINILKKKKNGPRNGTKSHTQHKKQKTENKVENKPENKPENKMENLRFCKFCAMLKR